MKYTFRLQWKIVLLLRRQTQNEDEMTIVDASDDDVDVNFACYEAKVL